MSEKKMVSRDVAIALGIVCILLIVSLGGVIAYYTTVVNNKDTTYNNYVSSTQIEITNLQNQASDLTTALNLGKSISASVNLIDLPATLSNNPTKMDESIISMYPAFGTYAGFASIQVSSTANDTFINVMYSSHGVDYNSQTYVGMNGTANFPVLPTNLIVVIIGTHTINASANMTITYTY